MSLAVCLLFDPASERRLRELWARIEAAGVPSMASHTHGRHHPHLSYAVLRTWDLAQVQQTLAELAPGEPFSVSFHGTLSFPRGRAALAPAITADVARRQDAVVAALEAAGADLHRNYVRGAWVPHVSVATRAPGTLLPVVVKAVADALPLTVRVDRAALVDSGTGDTWPLAGVL
jgi:2'-5' RNA ligase